METLGLSGSTAASRNWVLELLWPVLQNDVAADTALRNGMYVCFAAGVLGAAGAMLQKSIAAGIIVVLYLAFLGVGIRAGSRTAAITAFIYFALNCIVSFRLSGIAAVSIIPLIVLALLLGSVRASFYSAARRRRNAASPVPPDLPDSAYYGAAPVHLREAANRDAGFENRLQKMWRAIWPAPEIAVGFSWFFLCFSILAVTVCHLYLLPTGSMQPTLRQGDQLMSLNASFMGRIHRGDIVVFKYPLDPRSVIIKRVAGVPGDRIQVLNNHLVLNGKAIPEPYIERSPQFRPEDFPSSNTYPMYNSQLQALHDLMYAHDVRNNQLIVPSNSYFVLGDRRSDSLDSRFFGPVSQKDVMGRVVLVYGNTKGGTPLHFIERVPLGPA